MAQLTERWAAAKPYVVGLVIGAVAVPIIGIWGGQLVTAGTLNSQVTTATVDTRAAICEALARQHHLASGGESLAGHQNRQAREALAREFAVMPGQDTAEDAVRRACINRLARAA
jgi:hypothetical protein